MMATWTGLDAQVSGYTYPFTGDGGFIYYNNMMTEPWYKTTWAGTHNSYSNNNEPDRPRNFQYDYKIKDYMKDVYGSTVAWLMGLFAKKASKEDASSLNQYLSIKQQLEAGIRFMKLDLIPLYSPNSIDMGRLAYLNNPGTYFIHGDNVVGMAEILPTLEEVAEWIEDNPHEVIIWDIDFVQDKGGFNIKWDKWNGIEYPKGVEILIDNFDPNEADHYKGWKDFADAMKTVGIWDNVAFNHVFETDNHSSTGDMSNAWDNANVDDNWPSLTSMINSGQTIVMMPDFIENKKYNPPIHWIVDLHNIRL